jgi:hypothetical protein
MKKFYETRRERDERKRIRERETEREREILSREDNGTQMCPII